MNEDEILSQYREVLLNIEEFLKSRDIDSNTKGFLDVIKSNITNVEKVAIYDLIEDEELSEEEKEDLKENRKLLCLECREVTHMLVDYMVIKFGDEFKMFVNRNEGQDV